jgi:hypothetical protein
MGWHFTRLFDKVPHGICHTYKCSSHANLYEIDYRTLQIYYDDLKCTWRKRWLAIFIQSLYTITCDLLFSSLPLSFSCWHCVEIIYFSYCKFQYCDHSCLPIPSLKILLLPLLKGDTCKSNNFIGKNKSSSFEPLLKWANMFALFHDYESFCSKINFVYNCFFEWNLLQLVIKNKYSCPNMSFFLLIIFQSYEFI